MKSREMSRQTKYNNYEWSAQKYGHKFDITRFDFDDLAEQSCTFCGSEDCGNIHRKDLRLGYTKENCIPACVVCKAVISRSSMTEFQAWIDRICAKHSKK